MIYTLDEYSIIRDETGKIIPQDENNQDYNTYLQWFLAGGVLTQIKSNAPPRIVPKSVTPRQIRLALNQIGKRAIIEQFIANSSQNVQDVWNYSVEVHRNNPLLVQLAPYINLSSDDLDELFILAETL